MSAVPTHTQPSQHVTWQITVKYIYMCHDNREGPGASSQVESRLGASRSRVEPSRVESSRVESSQKKRGEKRTAESLMDACKQRPSSIGEATSYLLAWKGCPYTSSLVAWPDRLYASACIPPPWWHGQTGYMHLHALACYARTRMHNGPGRCNPSRRSCYPATDGASHSGARTEDE